MTTYTLTKRLHAELAEVLDEAARIFENPEAMRYPIMDELQGFALMLRDLQPNTQEPTAWIRLARNGKPSGHVVEFKDHNDPVFVPLYTHAAPQKPLTDGQLDAVFQSIKYDLIAIPGGSAYVPAHRMTIVRAIEAAHEMGVKPTRTRSIGPTKYITE